MRLLLTVAVLGAMLLGVYGQLAPLGVFGIERGSALDQPALIRIFAVETRRSFEGRNPGDHFVALSVLKDRRNDIIGHSSISCTRSFGNLSTCEATYVLPRGKIMAQGTLHARRYFVLAIVGGTGLYSNVGGVVDSLANGRPHTHRLLFSLEP